MKKRLTLWWGCCVVIVLMWLQIEQWHVSAPELFDRGRLYLLRSHSQDVVGVVIGWGIYGLYGNAEDCRLVPLYSPLVDATKTPCRLEFNGIDTRFRGWVDFRGHPRPFCGALRVDNLPRPCMLRSLP